VNISDQIAQWLEQRGIEYAFGIIGGGNVTLWDAIARRGKTALISVHHEQAAAMAATFANRVRGRHCAIALVTTGAGSTNAITGVMDAWMDSVPLLVISGNEAQKFIDHPQERGFGVQGYDSVAVATPFTKYAARLTPSDGSLIRVLDTALAESCTGRPGPVWVDIGQDVQRATI